MRFPNDLFFTQYHLLVLTVRLVLSYLLEHIQVERQNNFLTDRRLSTKGILNHVKPRRGVLLVTPLRDYSISNHSNGVVSHNDMSKSWPSAAAPVSLYVVPCVKTSSVHFYNQSPPRGACKRNVRHCPHPLECMGDRHSRICAPRYRLERYFEYHTAMKGKAQHN